jgi:hypothetical protein
MGIRTRGLDMKTGFRFDFYGCLTPKHETSFCVALRSQPIDPTAPSKPFVDFSLRLKSPDVSNFGPGIVGLDLPIAFGDALQLEGDPGFAHRCIMPILGMGASLAPCHPLPRCAGS